MVLEMERRTLKQIPKKFKVGEFKRNGFLDTYYLIKLNFSEINKLDRFITNNKKRQLKLLNQKKKKSQSQMASLQNSTRPLKEN